MKKEPLNKKKSKLSNFDKMMMKDSCYEDPVLYIIKNPGLFAEQKSILITILIILIVFFGVLFGIAGYYLSISKV